ncbi:hypothetical protein [Marilutibacter aestuarii]|nr:hypothetical protein [Lysobacter aestuarii]
MLGGLKVAKIKIKIKIKINGSGSGSGSGDGITPRSPGKRRAPGASV